MNNEFLDILEPYMNNYEFSKLKNIIHHGITRYEHSFRVAYYTYKITKILHLNYIEATVASLLHDFFTDEVENENALFKLRRHPKYAVINASKYFYLTDLQKDIIGTHMFPITFTPPKYLESWIVNIIDDVVACYELLFTFRKEFRAATTFLFILIMNYIK